MIGPRKVEGDKDPRPSILLEGSTSTLEGGTNPSKVSKCKMAALRYLPSLFNQLVRYLCVCGFYIRIIGHLPTFSTTQVWTYQ